MQKIPKAALLRQLEAQIEQQLRTVTGKFQNLQAEQLLSPAAQGGWGIAQCLEHLNSYGRYYLPEVEKAISKAGKHAAVSGVFKGSWLGSYFTRMMQPGDGTKKYKSPRDHMPARDLDAHAVLAVFMAQQEQLLQLVRTAANVDLDEVRVPVSISRWIKLKLGDVFQFLVAHNARHILQAEKCLHGN